jgi:hypothetical protein
MQYVAWLLDEAWEHRRHRYRRFGIALVAAGAITALVSVALSHGHGLAASSTAPRADEVASSTVLSKAPYMGVRCPIANSIACDRVGLAVWLKRPAVSVTATIAGEPLNLDWFGEERRIHGVAHRDFDGYLQPAGIVSRLHVRPAEGTEALTKNGHTRLVNSHQMWFGAGNAQPLVRLTIRYPDGKTLTTQLHVGLGAGWG